MALSQLHVLGQGAIGSMLLARALRNNMKVSCEVRSNTDLPVSVVDLDGVETVLPLSTNGIHPIQADSLVILPLKAYHIEQALISLQNRLQAGCSVLLLHNGIVDVSAYIQRLLPCPVYVATTSHAAKRKEHKVMITGHGQTQVGTLTTSKNNSDSGSHDDVCNVLNRLIGPVTFERDIKKVRWRKLIVNAVINPLTAIHQITNGELLDEAFTQLIVNIIEESIRVAKCDGVELEVQAIHHLVVNVINDTSKNHSSMVQDVLYRRPTEIGYINGYIVKLGQQYGILTPINSTLLAKVSALSDTY